MDECVHVNIQISITVANLLFLKAHSLTQLDVKNSKLYDYSFWLSFVYKISVEKQHLFSFVFVYVHRNMYDDAQNIKIEILIHQELLR